MSGGWVLRRFSGGDEWGSVENITENVVTFRVDFLTENVKCSTVLV